MKQLIDFFKNKQIHSILDVGTGTGDFITVLKKVFPSSSITGVDPNSESLKEAKRKFPLETFIELSGERLEFFDSSFDVASISMALHHLPDIQKTLKEMQRVIKPGGWIIVNELFSDNLNEAQEVHKLFHHFRSRIDRLNGVSHNETFKKEEILQLVQKSGIKIQFYFEYKKGKNLTSKPEYIQERVEKMQQMLDSVKNLPEYKILLPKIEEFKVKAKEHGFQPATNVVIVGKATIKSRSSDEGLSKT